MTEFLIILELKGKRTETLNGHIIPKRVKATSGKIFEESYEVIAIQIL